MSDRGFDLDGRVGTLEREGRKCELTPVDRVAERGHFAPPPNGGLPVLETEEALVFASNNYLGLTADQRVQDAARQAAATVGTGSGASRVDCGDTIVHHDLERLLAETKETDRALAFSSGYAAAVGTIGALAPDVVFVDEYTTQAIRDGCRLAGADVVCYTHCDAADLEDRLQHRAPTSDGESWLVVTDTVFAIEGTVAPLSELCDVAEAAGAWVLVDESHATGLYANGGGMVQAADLADRIHVQLGTLSGPLASQGGYVAGSEALIDLVTTEAGSFRGSAGLTPTAAAAASEALHIARHSDCRERLWENVTHLRDGLETIGYSVGGESQILPVHIGDVTVARTLRQELRKQGILVQALEPPAVPEGTSRLRLTPMASHDSADIVTCLEAFQAVSEDVDM